MPGICRMISMLSRVAEAGQCQLGVGWGKGPVIESFKYKKFETNDP
jgi:hypothetical protein